MSFAPSGYIVDIAKIKAVYGSKKSALIKAVIEKRADDLKHNAEWFSDEIADGAPTLEVALREIVDGKCTHRTHGFQYVYAIELLSKHLGTCLFMADFINCGFLDAFQPVAPKSVRKLLSSHNASNHKPALLKIPMPKDAVPGMGVYTKEECKAIADALARTTLEPDRKIARGVTGADLADGFTEIKDWFGRAVKARRGLLMFWY